MEITLIIYFITWLIVFFTIVPFFEFMKKHVPESRAGEMLDKLEDIPVRGLISFCGIFVIIFMIYGLIEVWRYENDKK